MEGRSRAEEARCSGHPWPCNEPAPRGGREVRRADGRGGEVATSRSAVLHPLLRVAQRAEPAVRSRDGRLVRLAAGGRAEGGHTLPGGNSWRGRQVWDNRIR